MVGSTGGFLNAVAISVALELGATNTRIIVFMHQIDDVRDVLGPKIVKGMDDLHDGLGSKLLERLQHFRRYKIDMSDPDFDFDSIMCTVSFVVSSCRS